MWTARSRRGADDRPPSTTRGRTDRAALTRPPAPRNNASRSIKLKTQNRTARQQKRANQATSGVDARRAREDAVAGAVVAEREPAERPRRARRVDAAGRARGEDLARERRHEHAGVRLAAHVERVARELGARRTRPLTRAWSKAGVSVLPSSFPNYSAKMKRLACMGIASVPTSGYASKKAT